MGDRQATLGSAILLIPPRGVDELAAENRVLADDRVGIDERVANPEIADQYRGGHFAAVDTTLEPPLALQEACRRVGPVESFRSAQDMDRVELYPVILRYEIDADPSRGCERTSVIHRNRAAREKHGSAAREYLRLGQPDDDCFIAIGWRNVGLVDPGWQRLGRGIGACCNLNDFEIRRGRRGLRRGWQRGNACQETKQ